MRLNLGCGDDIRPGYTNVDFRKTGPSVVQADLSKFPWPFESESAEEILMLDFLEHFPYRQTSVILMECHRVLRPGGELVVQVPDAEILASVLVGSAETQYLPFQCNRCGFHRNTNICDIGDDRCGKCSQSLADTREAAMMRMFGGQDYPGNFHQVCFTRDSLKRKATNCGFDFSSFEEEEQQRPNWNFKVRFRKGDLWSAEIG